MALGASYHRGLLPTGTRRLHRHRSTDHTAELALVMGRSLLPPVAGVSHPAPPGQADMETRAEQLGGQRGEKMTRHPALHSNDRLH